MSSSPLTHVGELSADASQAIDRVCTRFERAWQAGETPRLEDFSGELTGPEGDVLFIELLRLEVEYRRCRREMPSAEQYAARFSVYKELIARHWAGIVAEHPALPEQFPANDTASLAGRRNARDTELLDRPLPKVRGYEIIEELGHGGMGVIYKARQLGLNRLVALKMVLAGAHASAEFRRRFLAEAEAVAKLSHPHIVQIHEIGEQDGVPFFSMELVHGTPLDRLIAGSPQPPREAAWLVATLARAMDYAHQHGIVHRDLKPANVLLVSGGVVSGESDGRPTTACSTTHDSPLTSSPKSPTSAWPSISTPPATVRRKAGRCWARRATWPQSRRAGATRR